MKAVIIGLVFIVGAIIVVSVQRDIKRQEIENQIQHVEDMGFQTQLASNDTAITDTTYHEGDCRY